MISPHEQAVIPSQDKQRYSQEDHSLVEAGVDFYLREEEAILPDNKQDEAFYLANRTFYTTCHKISRQNSPSYRKKPPYTFLENWLIHSVFSKSQQILLRFPVIHPRVMMTEGDFIYTPHQMANETTQHETHHQQEENGAYLNDDYFQEDYDYGDEDDYDYYDDTFVIGDEGVMMMSASAPDASRLTEDDEDDQKEYSYETSRSMLMDENMWMGHGRHHSGSTGGGGGGGLMLHVANPDIDTEKDEEEEEDPMYRHVTTGHTSYKSSRIRNSQLQIVQEEDEEDLEEEEEKESPIADTNNQAVSLSPEVLYWYRSADLRQKSEQDEPPQNDTTLSRQSSHSSMSSDNSTSSTSTTDGCSITSQHKDAIPSDEQHTSHSSSSMSRTSSASSYQSLADMMTEDEQPVVLSEEEEEDRCHERAMTASTYGTLLASQDQRSIAKASRSITQDSTETSISPIIQVSGCLVDAAWIALDLAQDYTEDNQRNKGVIGFIGRVFDIWKVLFSGAETMLSRRSYRMIRPQAVV
ncbi:hypothetical protein BD560DRAFT_491309 [Blakeslea trispora]|nr:hypothetical protein BD560DRAFT_491309 [Blakeslea trispora]